MNELQFARALITGASSGIGAAFAQRLARDGSDLIVVARDRGRLEALADSLHTAHGVTVDVIAVDLSTSDGLATVERQVTHEPGLDLLINNAGFAGYRPVAQLDPDLMERQIRLQMTAVARLTRAALPGMIERGAGAIINVSSTVGFMARLDQPRGIYPATKAFVTTFTELLAQELEGTGVRVQALCPALTMTEFHERDGRDVSRIPPSLFMSAEDVVQASLAGLALGEVICIPGLTDVERIAASQAARQHLFEGGLSGTPAPRYRRTAPD